MENENIRCNHIFCCFFMLPYLYETVNSRLLSRLAMDLFPGRGTDKFFDGKELLFLRVLCNINDK